MSKHVIKHKLRDSWFQTKTLVHRSIAMTLFANMERVQSLLKQKNENQQMSKDSTRQWY